MVSCSSLSREHDICPRDDGNCRSVFDQVNHLVSQWWQDSTDCLRQDDDTHGISVGESLAVSSFILDPLGTRLDTCTNNFRDIGSCVDFYTKDSHRAEIGIMIHQWSRLKSHKRQPRIGRARVCSGKFRHKHVRCHEGPCCESNHSPKDEPKKKGNNQGTNRNPGGYRKNPLAN